MLSVAADLFSLALALVVGHCLWRGITAAWSAAGSAAWSAAGSAARAEFNALVYETFAGYL